MLAADPHDEAPPEKLDARDAEPHEEAAPPECGEGIRFDELLCVFREPVEWALALAERRAHGDPIDRAAIHRVRDAFRLRLASIASGCTGPTDGARIRVSDLVVIAGLLIGAGDPAIAQRAARDAGESLLDALAIVLQLDPTLGSQIAHAAAHRGRAPVHGTRYPAGAFWSGDERRGAALPLAPTPRLWRSVLSLWFRPHTRLGL
ncbi:MAG TPA: hypothetical protein VFT22_36365 [Kofleriaceae bacterium]|nr:hypothetical protein [Kofleriaceae bacterium]